MNGWTQHRSMVDKGQVQELQADRRLPNSILNRDSVNVNSRP